MRISLPTGERDFIMRGLGLIKDCCTFAGDVL